MNQEDRKDDVTLSQFLDAVAGPTATPGGGSVSALAGTLAAALVEMVANLTAGKKSFESQKAEMEKLGVTAISDNGKAAAESDIVFVVVR
jgi:formiminotetrahydrofolate cyclodeaminase